MEAVDVQELMTIKSGLRTWSGAVGMNRSSRYFAALFVRSGCLLSGEWAGAPSERSSWIEERPRLFLERVS